MQSRFSSGRFSLVQSNFQKPQKIIFNKKLDKGEVEGQKVYKNSMTSFMDDSQCKHFV